MSLDEDFARAAQLHREGQVHEAELQLRAILRGGAKHAPSWHLLGLIAQQAGHPEAAIECLREALKLAPQHAPFYHNLALVHHEQGDTQTACRVLDIYHQIDKHELSLRHLAVQLRQAEQNPLGLGIALRELGNALAAHEHYREAVNAYNQAIELRPTDPQLLNNFGVVCMELGDAVAASECYRRAIAARPEIAESHNNLGNSLVEQGQIGEAIAEFREALKLKPNYPKCANNLAVVLIGTGEFEEAVKILRGVIALRPDVTELHGNLGVCLKNLGRAEEAVAAYRRAIAIDPEFVDSHLNLGNLLLDLGRLDEAVASYEKTVELDPADADARRHLALAYKRQGSAEQARIALEGALKLEPDDRATTLRAAVLVPMVFESKAAMQEQRDKLLAVAREYQHCDFPFPREELLTAHLEAPFHAQFLDSNLREFRAAYAAIFGKMFPDERPAAQTERPRIGFFVSKGHERVFCKSLRGVLTQLDRELCDVVVLGPTISAQRLAQEFADISITVVRLPERADRLVEAVRSLSLDVLYHWEVGTDATNYFLPMFRLAPVQCTSWGLQLTSGMPQMDYYLSSKLVEGQDAAEHYTEQLLLADTLLTYQTRPALPPVLKTRDELGLRDDQHVLTCAQHLGKFHPDFDPLIAQILRRDGKAVLVVTEDRYRHGATLLQARWEKSIGDVASRIVWLPRLSQEDYYSLLATSDVLLDPPHFGGVNSTYDGLALGKPIVTIPSRYQRGRYTLGCYRKMNLLDCVARDAAGYIDLAVRLATDADYREGISHKIRAAGEVLWEDQQAVREHERLLTQMIERSRKA